MVINLYEIDPYDMAYHLYTIACQDLVTLARKYPNQKLDECPESDKYDELLHLTDVLKSYYKLDVP